ncbi:MAG: hypothetical protein HRU38_17135 [Saccharospirillaceae bacterium]|nr:hypothetical protein [Saccharospirillaceae bacterium]
MQNKVKVSDEITKSSAVASWSGFIYQGKVALYQAIKILTNDKLSFKYDLKVEHLDDFAIFENNTALFIHQVKSTQSKYRNSYKKALDQAADVISPHFTANTRRYFHVSVDITDFSNHVKSGKTVKFYKYDNDKFFVAPDEMDLRLKKVIANYLESNSNLNTDALVEHKLDRLNSLVANRVNFAHAVNQKTNSTQYESTDAAPIKFTEIIECLKSEVLDFKDKNHVLFMFKNSFIQVIDEIANYHDSCYEDDITDFDEDEILDYDEKYIKCLSHLSSCKKTIASLNDNLLEKLYFSLDPSNIVIDNISSKSSIRRYLDIIDTLPLFISNNNLPHYINDNHGKYIPSSIELDGFSKNAALNVLNNHLTKLSENTALLELLFEFDNLIVKMSDASFNLDSYTKRKATHNGNCIDAINDNEFIAIQEKITKAKKIRFVPSNMAKGELN